MSDYLQENSREITPSHSRVTRPPCLYFISVYVCGFFSRKHAACEKRVLIQFFDITAERNEFLDHITRRQHHIPQHFIRSSKKKRMPNLMLLGSRKSGNKIIPTTNSNARRSLLSDVEPSHKGGATTLFFTINWFLFFPYFSRSLLLSSSTRKRVLPSATPWTSRGHRCFLSSAPIRFFIFIAERSAFPFFSCLCASIFFKLRYSRSPAFQTVSRRY